MIRINQQPNEAERLAAQAPDDRAFDIQYCHQRRPSSVRYPYDFTLARVVMIRHAADRMLGDTEDSFTCHLAGSGEWLGTGDTKRDAELAAAYELMKWSEREYERAQQ